jgi:hypothetical protein
MTPTTDLSRALLASALGHLGRLDEARQICLELMEINPRYSYVDHFGRLPLEIRPRPTSSPKVSARRVWRSKMWLAGLLIGWLR